MKRNPATWSSILASAWASQLVTHSSQPQGEEVRGTRSKFLAYLACLEDSAPYVARGLLQILQPKDSQFLDADGRKLFTDRLLKGKSDPTACPEVRGFTFGRPFQADAYVSLIDLVGDSGRARLRTNSRSRDGGVRQELAAGVANKGDDAAHRKSA